MRVVITGIGGYVASNIASALPETWEVIGVGRATKFDLLRSLFGARVRLVEADVMSPVLAEVCRGADAVVHAAAPIRERDCQERPEEARRVIVDGTRAVTDAALAAGCRLVHLSTLSVYSTHLVRPQPVTEESELLPDTTYGILKAEAEREAARANALILRLSNVFGQGVAVPPHAHVVTTILRDRARRGEPLVLHDAGEEAFDFIHVRDVARFVREALEHPPALPLVLNVSAGQAIRIAALAETYRRVARELWGRDVPVRTNGASGRAPRPSRWLANDRIRALAPWFPALDIEAGVREMMETP
jgi:nucleoside-diphosphate-sugar epimerase